MEIEKLFIIAYKFTAVMETLNIRGPCSRTQAEEILKKEGYQGKSGDKFWARDPNSRILDPGWIACIMEAKELDSLKKEG